MRRRQPPPVTVTLPCPDCGPVVVSASDVSVVCIDGVAREVTYSCPSCRLRRSLAASAESLSLLHHAGVRTVEQRSARDDELDSRSDDGEEKVTTARQVVSLKILLEQPDFLTRLDATPESTREVPPANPR